VTFFGNILAPKNCKAKRNKRKAAQFAYVQKCACKMLMKLTPSIICISMLIFDTFTFFQEVRNLCHLTHSKHLFSKFNLHLEIKTKIVQGSGSQPEVCDVCLGSIVKLG